MHFTNTGNKDKIFFFFGFFCTYDPPNPFLCHCK